MALHHLARTRREARGAAHAAAVEQALEHIAARREAQHACAMHHAPRPLARVLIAAGRVAPRPLPVREVVPPAAAVDVAVGAHADALALALQSLQPRPRHALRPVRRAPPPARRRGGRCGGRRGGRRIGRRGGGRGDGRGGGRARARSLVEVAIGMVARAAARGVATRPLARVDDVTWRIDAHAVAVRPPRAPAAAVLAPVSAAQQPLALEGTTAQPSHVAHAVPLVGG